MAADVFQSADVAKTWNLPKLVTVFTSAADCATCTPHRIPRSRCEEQPVKSGNYRRPQHGLISAESVVEIAGRVQRRAGDFLRQRTFGAPGRRGCLQPSRPALFNRATSPDVRGKLRCDAPPGEGERQSPVLVSKACLTRASSHAPVRWQPDGHRKRHPLPEPEFNPRSTSC